MPSDTVAEPPMVMSSFCGTLSVKPGGSATIRSKGTDRGSNPAADPTSVRVEVPRAASFETTNATDPLLPVPGDCTVAVTPAGRPVTVRVTAPLKPPTRATPTAKAAPVVPRSTSCEVDAAVRVKPGGISGSVVNATSLP
jgi:hypothetical protein